MEGTKEPRRLSYTPSVLTAIKTPVYTPQEIITSLHITPAQANLYAYGWCTWGVASWTPVPGGMGNANLWNDAAAKMGYIVSKVPVVGAVAQTDAGWGGHVGLVEAVNPDGTVLIKEMNYQGWNITDERPTPIGDWVYLYF